MSILKSLLLCAATLTFVSCQTADQPSDASEAVYKTPDLLDNQRDIQELHGDILRQDF